MIACRTALLQDLGGFPDFLVEAQLELARHPQPGAVETDDFILICEFLLRFQTRHFFWGQSRYEEVTLENSRWNAIMEPANGDYDRIVAHFGGYRVLKRGDRYQFLNSDVSYRDLFEKMGNSLRLDPFFTKMRRYIEMQAAVRANRRQTG